MRIVAITQARYGSTRLPGKVLKSVQGITLLQIHLERIKKSKKIDKLIVATTFEKESRDISAVAESLGVDVFKGSTDNVLERFYYAVKDENADFVVRVTSDCPLIDAEVIDAVIQKCLSEDLDYCSNTLIPSYPDGCDIEIFKFSALERAFNNATLKSEHEHVTPYIWKNSSFFGGSLFSSGNYSNEENYSEYRLTVDEPEDFELISKLIHANGYHANWKTYADLLKNDPTLRFINKRFKRNEGYEKSLSKDYMETKVVKDFTNSISYKERIHQLIPGGAHTYSKGDDQFPERAPAAIKRGQGSYVWDIDDNKYLDCSMGLTSVSLGHAYEPVISSIKEELENGVNFQRPSVLEKVMAEKFLSLVPQHDMIKFAKNGSIVTTAAVKLARAFTGRSMVAFPGDHPFYSYDDWFIGKTACNRGVPEEISNLSVTFDSCDINALKEMFSKYPNQIACVIMEPEKNIFLRDCSDTEATGEYLKRAIEITHENGALFILDEMVTGFKTGFPGSISKYNLEPDMATWGKGIANGFSFCALTGKKQIMELGGIVNKGQQKVFLISTTHGGETHAIRAAMTTIDEFEKHDVISHNHQIGQYLIDLCRAKIQEEGLERFIEITDTPWMPLFLFKDESGEMSLGFKSLAMQEMIARGVLFQGIFTPCFSHTKADAEYFAVAFHEMLLVYREGTKQGYKALLIGDPVRPVFSKIV